MVELWQFMITPFTVIGRKPWYLLCSQLFLLLFQYTMIRNMNTKQQNKGIHTAGQYTFLQKSDPVFIWKIGSVNHKSRQRSFLNITIKRLVQGYFCAMFLPIIISCVVVLKGCNMLCLLCPGQHATCQPYMLNDILFLLCLCAGPPCTTRMHDMLALRPLSPN